MRKQVKFSFVMSIVVIVMLIAAFSSCISIFIDSDRGMQRLFNNSNSTFETGWFNEYGLAYDVSTLATRDLEFDSEKALYLTKKVPEFEGEAAIFFRTNNLVVNVYLNDKQIHFTSDSGHYDNLASFNSYCYTSFSEADIGKEIKLEIFKTPMARGYCIDNFVFGDPTNVTFAIFSSDASVIVSAFLTLVAGIVFIWMGFISRNTFEHFRGLLFFGMFSLLIGLWFMMDTLFLYNAIRDISVIEQCSRIFLSAAVPCFMMYIFEFFNIRYKNFYITLTISGFALFAILFIFNATGVIAYGHTNFINHIYILVCGITLLVEMISYLALINGNKGKSKVFNIGVVFFVFFALFDLGRYYQGNEGDSSLSTRFGIFILAVTVVAATTNEVIDLLKLGIQAGKIGKIAYTDANTGLGNPAAFKNKFEELDRTKVNYSYIGIIQFDVNNLKIINDSLGHEAGDLLIKTAADIIDKSFGTIGNCYRVGGDEFVAITTYNHAPLVCEEAILKFESAIEKFNNNPDKPFDLRIAYGVAYYQNTSQQFQSLKEVHKLADERMYNKKKELKARFAKSPEEMVIR